MGPRLLDNLTDIERWANEEKTSVVNQIIALIHEDAPKNKFSILAGRLRLIEDLESKIESIRREPIQG